MFWTGICDLRHRRRRRLLAAAAAALWHPRVRQGSKGKRGAEQRRTFVCLGSQAPRRRQKPRPYACLKQKQTNKQASEQNSQTIKQTNKNQTNKQTNKHKQTNKQTNKQLNKYTKKQTNKTNKQTRRVSREGQTKGQLETGRQTQTNKQTNANKQTNKQRKDASQIQLRFMPRERGGLRALESYGHTPWPRFDAADAAFEQLPPLRLENERQSRLTADRSRASSWTPWQRSQTRLAKRAMRHARFETIGIPFHDLAGALGQGV
jgi:hypothetical protein